MAEFSVSDTIERSPDEVWAVLADIGAIADWFPGLESSRADGDRRSIELAGVGTIVELVTRSDASTRTLEYTIAEAPFDIDRYEARWTVEPKDGASFVTWHLAVEPEAMVELMQATAEGAIAGLKAHLEG